MHMCVHVCLHTRLWYVHVSIHILHKRVSLCVHRLTIHTRLLTVSYMKYLGENAGYKYSEVLINKCFVCLRESHSVALAGPALIL